MHLAIPASELTLWRFTASDFYLRFFYVLDSLLPERKVMRTLNYQQTTRPPMPVPIFDAPTWMFGAVDGLVSPDLEEFHFPDRIIIVGTLKPYYVESDAVGHYQDNSGTVFGLVPLYGDRSALSRIEWVADWIEQADGAAESLVDPLIWGMDFAHQEKSIVACYTLPSVEHPGFWKATQSSVEPVWPWGGMYALGCSLADIKPRYFSILPGGVKNDGGRKTADTKIAQVSSINPRYQVLCGATDDESAQAIFQPMSFLNHVQFGAIRYALPNIVDDAGYQSTDVVDYDPANGRVKILFLRRNHGISTAQH